MLWSAGDVKEPTRLSQRVGHEVPGVVVWPLLLKWGLGLKMLGDISYHKATLQSEGKHSFTFTFTTQSWLYAGKVAFLWMGASRVCRARFLPWWKRNALWGLVNKIHPNLAVFGFGEWETCPLRPPFEVFEIRGEPLISAFKQFSALMERV